LGKLVDLPVHLHHVGEPRDVDEGVAERARHLPVDERDHRLRLLGRRLVALDAHPVRAESVLVGRRELDEGHVHGEETGLDEAGDLGEEDGDEVGAAVVHRLADVGSHEERAVAEGPRVAGAHVVSAAEGHQVRDLDVPQLLVPCDESADQLLRVVAAGVDPDVVARLHRA
jgi:hypothetical protein